MRVLHLIDGLGGATTRLDLTSGACGLLAERTDGEHAACVVGTGAARRRASAMGAPVLWSVAPAAARASTAARGIRRVGEAWEPDVVHCWGAGVLSLSRLAFPVGTPTVAVIDEQPEPARGAARWLESPLTDAIMLCYDSAAREPLADLHPGVEVDLVNPPALAGVGGGDRESVRASLGLEEGDLAVLLIGDAPQADLLRFAFLLGLLEVAGRLIVGVAPRSAANRARGERLRRRSLRPIPLLSSDRPLLELARACDLAVWEAGGPGPTSHREADAGAGAVAIASVLACGVPVVAPHCDGLERLYPEQTSGACLARNSSLPELARALMELGDDAGLRARVASAVARHARESDWTGAFTRRVADAWAKVGASAAVHSGLRA
jgi:hypothetical protein